VTANRLNRLVYMDVVIRRSLVREDSKTLRMVPTSSMPSDLGHEVVFNAGTHYPMGLNFGRHSLKVTRNLKTVICRVEEGLFDGKMRWAGR